MKKVLMVVAALAVAGSAQAFTVGEAANFQAQTQDFGFITGPGFFVSGYTEDQFGIGGSTINGFEGQYQVQGAQGTIIYGNMAHTYDFVTGTAGTSNGGLHIEATTADMGVVTLQDSMGMNSVSGSAMTIEQGSAYIGNADAGTFAKGGTAYQNYNLGYSSYIYQEGYQVVDVGTNGGNVGVEQSGGTAAMNNGDGTAMAGGGYAYGSINATGNAGGAAAQQHSYEQAASTGMTFQYQYGTVGTYVAE